MTWSWAPVDEQKNRRYPLRTPHICWGLQKKVLHRTQTDVTFEEYFIMFHCQRELIIKDNVYEFDFFYKLLGKLLEDNKKLVLRITDKYLPSKLKDGQSW